MDFVRKDELRFELVGKERSRCQFHVTTCSDPLLALYIESLRRLFLVRS
jgi:hypothetical protein